METLEKDISERRAKRAGVKWDKLYFRRKARTQTGTKTPQMPLKIGRTHTHTHTDGLYSERAQQDIDILHTHTQHGEDLGLSLCVSQLYALLCTLFRVL